METRSVLVFAYYFPPMGLSGVQRVTKFMKYLPENGWHPHIITTGPTAYYAHDPSLLQDIEGRDIAVYRTSGTDPNSIASDQGTVKREGDGVYRKARAWRELGSNGGFVHIDW